MINKISGVYCIKNCINNKLYIGSSVDVIKRLHQHKKLLRKNKHFNKHLQKSYNKYGEHNFIFDIISRCDINKTLIEEQYYLDLYESYNPENGYNIAKNSLAPMKGRKHTKEAKVNMSIAQTGLKKPQPKGKDSPKYGKKESELSRQHKSESHKGLKQTKETINKRVLKNIENGVYNFSEEHCNNISKTRKEKNLSKGKNNCMYGTNLYTIWLNKYGKEITDNKWKEYVQKQKDNVAKPLSKQIIQLDKNNNIICEFSSITEAEKQLKISKHKIISIIKGKTIFRGKEINIILKFKEKKE
jgi:group I intron endonuclease